MRRAITAALLLIAACKTDDAKPAVTPPPAPQPPPARSAPLVAADAQRFDLELLERLAPELEGSKELAPLRIHASQQAVQSWCVPGTDAEIAAKSIANTLTREGWSDARSRGTGERAAASGSRDGVRISISVGGRDARCLGLVATATYVGGTVTLPPPLEEGERIR